MHTYPKNVPICSEYVNSFYLLKYTTFKVITSVTPQCLSHLPYGCVFCNFAGPSGSVRGRGGPGRWGWVNVSC